MLIDAILASILVGRFLFIRVSEVVVVTKVNPDRRRVAFFHGCSRQRDSGKPSLLVTQRVRPWRLVGGKEHQGSGVTAARKYDERKSF
jgi:hypothetical protein